MLKPYRWAYFSDLSGLLLVILLWTERLGEHSNGSLCIVLLAWNHKWGMPKKHLVLDNNISQWKPFLLPRVSRRNSAEKNVRSHFTWQESKMEMCWVGCFFSSGGYQITLSQQVVAGKSHLYTIFLKKKISKTIPLSSHLTSSKMVWRSPLWFWTHTELYPHPNFVCWPNCLWCKGTRSIHLLRVWSLNRIVRLESLLLIVPPTAHTLFHCCCELV